MNKRQLISLLNNVKEEEKPTFNWYDRILIIDGLNLFLRNFAAVNQLNTSGNHIGGLGGFLRSLGSLINQIKPQSVYIIFDGVGSSINRKNLNPDYKSNRGKQKLTKWSVFDDLKEENTSKINQISRLIHYLKCLPVKTILLDKNEADDIIAFLALTFSKNYPSKTFIVSSDKDFIQLVNSDIIIYRPTEKEFYTKETVLEKYGVLAENFIIHKTLTGDSSDKIKGVKDLGPKTLLQKFPQLKDKVLNMDDIFKISEEKYKDHVIYSRILLDKSNLQNNFKIMDLKNPLLSDEEKDLLLSIVENPFPKLDIENFLTFYNEDGLGYIIKNVDYWVRETFLTLNNFNSK